MKKRSFLACVVMQALVPICVAQAPAAGLADNHPELEKAALAAGADGMFALGRSYQLGAGVPINYAQAVVWLQKAVDAGHPAAMTKLGMMYGLAAGVPYDLARSNALVARAAELGDPGARYAMSFRKQEPERSQWAEQAVAANDPAALTLRAIENGNKPEGRAMRQKAIQVVRPLADYGDLEALELLGFLHPPRPDGSALVAVLEETIKVGTRAANAGNGDAALKVANAHWKLSVTNGTFSKTAALAWARRAEAMGSPLAADMVKNLVATP